MAATSMDHVHAQAAANMDATTTAHANPTRLGAQMASIQITVIACARTTAKTVVTRKGKHAIARMPVRAAVTRLGPIASVRQVAQPEHHATAKQAGAPALIPAPMDAKKMAHATKHAKPYNAQAKMNNVKTVHV